MAAAPQQKTGTSNRSSPKRTNGNANGSRKTRSSAQQETPKRKSNGRFRREKPEMPAWLTAAVSIVGVGVAVGAGLYATRKQWMSKAEAWRDDFSAAFADDETDYENFNQTRNAGTDSMRDDQGDDWEDIDDMSDASFPASDPPSFNPGRA